MSFTQTSVTNHRSCLSRAMSILLEPRFSSQAGIMVPISRPTRNSTLTLAPLAGFTRCLDIERCFSSPNPRHLMTNSTTSPASLFTDIPNKGNIGRAEWQQSTIELKNWQMSNDQQKYIDQFHPTFRSIYSQRNNRTTEMDRFPDWLSNIRTRFKSNTQEFTKTEKSCLIPRYDILEKPNSRTESSNDIIHNMSSIAFHPKGLSTINYDAQPTIKHSIREILKPREDSHIINDNDRDGPTSQVSNKEPMNKKPCSGNHESLTHQKRSLSDEIISNKKTKYLCTEPNDEKISAFTTALSSYVQTLGVPSSQISKSMKQQSTFDFHQYPPDTNPEIISAQKLLDPCSLSPHSAFTREQNERKAFQCPQCRYLTDRKNNLKRHIVTMHQDSGKVLECCGIPFQSKAALRDHNTIFHRGGYRCRICTRNFCRKALLRRHLSVHSGQKDFYCEICGYATSHKSNLERHQKVHNKRIVDANSIRAKQCVQTSLEISHDHVKNESLDERRTLNQLPETSTPKRICNDAIKMIGSNSDAGESRSDLYQEPEIKDSLSIQETIVPSRYKNKRVNFFTCRLEETYKDSLMKHSPSPNISSNFTELEEGIQHFDKVVIGESTLCTNYHTNHGENCQFHEELESKPITVDINSQGRNDILSSCHSIQEASHTAGKVGDLSLSSTPNSTLHSREYTSHPSLSEKQSSKSDQVLSMSTRNDAMGQEEVSTKPKRLQQTKSRMCPLIYSCDDCGQKLPNQYELQSHTCSKFSINTLMDISLVIALQKGTLKSTA